MHKLLAIGCVCFTCERTLVSFGHAGAVQSVGPSKYVGGERRKTNDMKPISKGSEELG